jgi:carbonic anhydrase
MSAQGPGSCGRDGCLCHGQPSDAKSLLVRESRTMPTLTRRRLFGATLGGAAAAVLSGIGTELAAPEAASAQSTLSPDGALQALMDGNQRFVERRLTCFREDIDMLIQHTAEKQEPFASVLACADSRVPVELVFDQSIGHVFVNRVAGNIATSEIIASIEYGAAVLGTKVIVVLGHGACGAVKATIAAKVAPGQISSLYSYIRPAVNRANGDLDAAIAANAQIQAQLLRESSPVVAGLLEEGKIKVAAAILRPRQRQSEPAGLTAFRSHRQERLSQPRRQR